MITLGQMALATAMYSAGAVSVSIPQGPEVSVSIPDLPPGINMIAMTGQILGVLFLLSIVIGTVILIIYRSRQRERLIAMAMEHNQPEVAREIIGKRGGFGRFLLWIVLIIAALVLLDKSPILVFLGAALLIIYLGLGSERRANILRRAADKTAGVQNWLTQKADENEQKAAPGPPEPPRQEGPDSQA